MASPFRFCPRLEALEDRLVPSTFSVTGTTDSGPNTLRQAILFANAHPGTTITFNIGGAGVHDIALLSPLPTITAQVAIKGATQPGYAGSPLIQLDGFSAGSGTQGSC